MKKEKLGSNIWKLYLIRGLSSFMLLLPVIVLFFQENGLAMKEVFVLQSLFSLAVIILEFPTGNFADFFGRKRSMIIGTVLATAGFAIYSQSHVFWGFLLGEIILGIGVSFISGTDSAMLYETLLSEGRELECTETEGKKMAIGMLSESIASVFGGFAAIISLRFPLYCDVAISFLAIPLAFTLVEPERRMAPKEDRGLKSMVRLIKYLIFEQKQVLWLIIYSAFVGASTLTMFWFIQPYLLATKVPLGMFGVVLSIFLLTAAFFSWKAHSIEHALGRKRALVLLIVLPVLGYLLASSFWFVWSGVFILLFYVVRGINNPIMLAYINGLISSDFRASILSVKNLVGRLVFSVIGPIVGWIGDLFSLKTGLLSSGATFLVLGLVALAFLRKHKAL